MINKENDDKKVEENQSAGPVDVAYMDVQSHILIKDIDTNEVLVNQRG